MPIIQVPLDVPDDIYLRVLSGEYVRFGGVIRDQGGHLVKLLDEGIRIEEAQEAAKAGLDAVLRNRTVVGVALGVVAVAAAAGGAAVQAKRSARSAETAAPSCVDRYGESLTAYLEAAGRGQLTVEVIDRLMADLDAVKAELEGGSLAVSPEGSEALVEVVAEHTRALSDINGRELTTPDASQSSGATIIELRPYLKAQRDLFSEAG